MTFKPLTTLILLATGTSALAQDTSQDTGQGAAAEMTEQEAQAQAEMQAAATNATLAMKLCLEGYRDAETLLQSFQDAGFAYETEDFGGGPDDVLHWFTTPDEDVQTAVVIGLDSVECRIGTGLWGVEAMLPFAQEAFGTLTDGVEVLPGSPEGANILPGTAEAQADACSGFHALLPQTMLWVQILSQGNDGSCISDGTSVIGMRF